jgi:hypothetical protein
MPVAKVGIEWKAERWAALWADFAKHPLRATQLT